MAEPMQLPAASLARVTFNPRNVGRWLAGSAALICAMAVYCELCSIVGGLPAPGAKVSIPWALQVSSGWILVGTALGALGSRVTSSSFASSRPRALLFGAVAGIALFTLSFEWLLDRLIVGDSSFLAFVHARGPMSLVAAALVVVTYAGNRMWMRRSTPAEPPAQPGADIEEAAPARLEVMTGTGRTTIRLEEIECLQADGNYINVLHITGRTYILRQTLVAIERSLDPARFVRVHRSTIVSRDKVKEHRRGGILVLQSGRTVRVSRASRERWRSPTDPPSR